MDQYEQVHAVISLLSLELDFIPSSRRVNLTSQLWILFKLKRISNFTETFVFDVALFEYEWCILFHTTLLFHFLPGSIYLNLDFFSRHDFFTFDFHMQCNRVSCLLRNDIIELSCEILTWE